MLDFSENLLEHCKNRRLDRFDKLMRFWQYRSRHSTCFYQNWISCVKFDFCVKSYIRILSHVEQVDVIYTELSRGFVRLDRFSVFCKLQSFGFSAER
jgi:hypothetical protein